MSDRRRILVLETPGHPARNPFENCPVAHDLVRVDSLAHGAALLRTETFDGIFLDPADPILRDGAGNLLWAKHILETLVDGVAVVGTDLTVLWANPMFETWCGGPAQGRGFYEALGSPEILGPDYCPFHTALAGKSATTRLHCHDNRYLELHITPVREPGSDRVNQLISLGRDVTAEVQQQQKLDALHRAGRELAALDTEQLAEMGPEERIELLKQNIRRFTHDLLHYDVIEVRLLDRQTGRLEPLLEEGMSPEAAQRVLYAEAKNNGVTGFVAATGKSYLCPDTANDPLYIEGAPGARSSLTVPLIYQDQVIGTFNVESPQPNAFDENDLQFAEIFSREIADALHTLELLSAEKRSTATQSIEAISREVALPVDEILTAAAAVLDRYIGHDPEMAEKLRQILRGARSIKQVIQKVGENIAPPVPAPGRPEDAHPRLKGMRVLVADNDERVRRSAHGLLGRWGCVVETARDGQEMLTMARLGNYDVILADIRLPDLSGYEAYRRLREAQPQARVILMTAFGYDPSHAIVKARQEGLRFVLYKPFRVDQLLAALENPEPLPPPAPAVARA
ncbi:MAG TPA: response regulator [Gemmataceae bacterium]|nr:response regulator [Gemmataceae bacterium]